MVRACPHCGAPNVMATCQRCGRRFIVTTAHLAGEPRAFEARPLAEVPVAVPGLCDFCAAGDRGDPEVTQVEAGLRQRTCASCHTEMIGPN